MIFVLIVLIILILFTSKLIQLFYFPFQAKQLDVDPRACIGSFFDRIQVADIEYKKHFDLEVEQFKQRITKRAAEKIEEALAEQEVRRTKHVPLFKIDSLVD